MNAPYALPSVHMKVVVVRAGVVLITYVATFSIASAQITTPQAATGELQEIVVTAEKRQTTVQETPISLTAITGADIQDRGFTDFDSLAQTVPGVSMRTSGPGQTEFEMRGMTSAGGNSSTVGFYLDDTPLTAPAGAFNGKVVIDPNLYDLNRVEVLRGPQGTLYGSGSMGGAIKLVPNAPDPTGFAASAQTIFSDTDGGGFNHGENGMINLPLASGTAALRLVGSESHDSGWIDRIVIADGAFPAETNNLTTRGDVLAAPVAADYKDVNDSDLKGVRVSLLWKPTDRLSITPSLLYQRIQQGGLDDIDSDPGTNAHYQPFDTPEPFSDRFDLYSINIQYSFEAFDLTSTTSRWDREEDLRQDGSEELQWALSAATGAFVSYYPSQGGLGATDPTSLESDQSKQTSEEIRLTSTGDSKFKWLVGYFYGDFQSSTNLNVVTPGAVPLFGTSDAFTQIQPTKIIQSAFFGEASYQLAPQLTATAGLRRFSYDSSLINVNSGYFSSTGSVAEVTSATGERDQGVNPKVNLSYQLNKDMLLYATAAKGFRPGGANTLIPTSGTLGDSCEADLMANHGTTSFVPAPVSFNPDTVWSYELGEKATVLGDRVTINGAAYVENWNHVQQYITLPCGFVYTDNSGDARVYGAELELNAALLPGLILSANAAYTHAAFVVASLEAAIPVGTRVQDVPDWTSSASLAYRHSISNQLALTARLENDYVGTRTDATFGVNNLPSYDLTNVRAGIQGDRWTAVLFANNIFNERALLSNTLQINVEIPMYNRVAVSRPLTVGIDLSYRFGR